MSLDLSHLLDVFLGEAREYVQSLDLALVALERSAVDGQLDRAALDEIFRVAHSLKGMCGMMGYQRMAALTHAMEESLLAVRDGRAEFDERRLDTLLACVEGLEAALDAIGSSRDEPEVLDDLARRVGAVDTDRTDDTDGSERLPTRPAEVTAGSTTQLDAVHPDGLQVHVRLAADTELRGVRAFVVLRALRRVGDVHAADPEDPASFDGLLVRAVMRSVDPEAVSEALDGMPEVEDVTIVMPGPDPVAEAALPTLRAEPTLRVASARLDDLMFQMQEVVVSTARLQDEVDASGSDELRERMVELSRHARQLQTSLMHVRMTPLDAAFARAPRLTRELAKRLGREVDLVVDGAETEVDRSMVDALADPLVHLIRNAVDHGIETPEQRRIAGKPPRATLRVSARHAAGHVVIEVADDGRGIDRDAVIDRAIQAGSLDPSEADRIRTADDLQELLCRPAVSTAQDVTEISGRGVGLDAVRSTVRRLGGRLQIESVPGRSTTVRLRLPMTLAVMPVLLVQAGSEDVAIPIDRIDQVARRTSGTTREVPGGRLIARDGKAAVGLVDLARALGHAESSAGASAPYVVTVHGLDTLVALEVDRLHGTLDVATRSLPAGLANSGAPLLGIGMLPAGGLVTIVDCDRLAPTTNPRTEVSA